MLLGIIIVFHFFFSRKMKYYLSGSYKIYPVVSIMIYLILYHCLLNLILSLK